MFQQFLIWILAIERAKQDVRICCFSGKKIQPFKHGKVEHFTSLLTIHPANHNLIFFISSLLSIH